MAETSEDGSEVPSTVRRPAALELLSETDVTPAGVGAFRPDVTAVAGELWLAYNSRPGGVRLQRFDANLSPLGGAVTLEQSADLVTDVRVGLSIDRFWYAYESVAMPDTGCDAHFLDVALYAPGAPPTLDRARERVATGCPTGIDFIMDPMGLPEHPEAVDDPTPFVHEGLRYVLTRAWPLADPIHHLRRLDDALAVAEETLLDTGGLLPGRTLGQNALLHIDGTPFLVGAFATGPPSPPSTADLYILGLSDDLRAFVGSPVRLAVTGATFPQRVTRARHVEGTLILNYIDTYDDPGSRMTHERLALFDAEGGFAFLSETEVQDHAVVDNHSTFEILGDRLYLFQQQDGERVSAKIFRLNP